MTTVACISAEDSNRISGLAADARTLERLGGEAAMVSCGQTRQDRRGAVQAIFPLAPTAFKKRLAAIKADSAKIGALLTPQMATAAGEWLEGFEGPVVLDPVLKASGGGLPLMSEPSALMELLPLVTLVTPNFEEGRILGEATTPRAMAKNLLARGAKAALIKGGHMPKTEPYGDFLATAEKTTWLVGERLPGDCRASGCALACAVALYLGGGATLQRAVELARDAIHSGIRESLKKSRKRGTEPIIWG